MSPGLWAKLTKLGILLFATFPSLHHAQPADTIISKNLFAKPSVMGDLRTGPVIKIGTPISLHPNSEHYALCTLMRHAYELFLRSYVTLHGGILYNGTRHAVELVLINDESSSTIARWAASHLIFEEGIKHFLGPYSSTITRRVAQRVNPSSRGVMVAPGASGSSTFRGRSRIFGTLPVSTYYVETSLELLAAADNGIRKSCYVITDSGTSSHAYMALKYNFTLLNDTRVPQDKGPSEAAVALVDDLVRRAPDVVVASVREESCHPLIKRIYEVGYSPKAIVLLTCPPGDEFISAVGNAGQFVIHATPWLPSMMLRGSVTGNWTSQSFADEFQRQFGAIPPYQVASAFTAAATLVRAIETADSLTPNDIRNTLRSMRVESIFGSFDFDSNGQSTLKMKVTQYQMASSPVLLHPCTSCGGTLVYPKPNRMNIECLDTTDIATPYGFLNGTCRECPRGTESVVVNASASLQRICRACAEGRAGLRSAGGVQTCMPCPRGFFSDVTGAQECTACPPGSFVDATASTACDACAVGRAASIPGKDECSECQEGTYQNETGRSTCIRCAEGTYGSSAGATVCAACAATFTTKGPGSPTASDCGCPRDTFDPSAWSPARAQLCEPCPEGLECPGFGAQFKLRPGYHVSPSDFNPLRGIWKCAVEASCPGGPLGTCKQLLEGVACGRCPEGYVRLPGAGCARCNSGNSILPIVACVVLPLVLVAVYYQNLRSKMLKETSVKLAVSITAGLSITFGQMLAMFYHLNIRWPDNVEPIMKGSSVLLADAEVFRLGCVAGREQQGTYYMQCMAPYTVIAVFMVLALASKLLPLVTRNRLQAWRGVVAFNAVGGLGQMTFIALAGIAATAFVCYDHPNGKYSMVKYPSILCFEGGAHSVIMFMGVFVLLTIVLPFVALSFWGCYSVYTKAYLYGVQVPQLTMYRFLIWRYRPVTWWWSTVFNVRQLLLAFAPMITPGDPSLQLSIVQVVLLTYLVLMIYYTPWRTVEINFLDGIVTSLLMCTLISVTSLTPRTTSEATHLYILLSMVATVVALLAVAILYSFGNVAFRGIGGAFGVSFPSSDRMQSFASSWTSIAQRVAQTSPEDQVAVLGILDNFDRMAIDRVMSILSSVYDIKRSKSWVNNKMQAEWVPKTQVLRVNSERASTVEQAIRSTASSDSTAVTREGSNVVGHISTAAREDTATSSRDAAEPRPQPYATGLVVKVTV